MNNASPMRQALPALTLFFAGVYILFEAASMTQFGAVFPRLAGGGLIIGSSVLLAKLAMGKPDQLTRPDRTGRALLLLVALMAWAVLLPVIGFVPACLVGAAATMTLADPKPPSLRVLARRSAGLLVLILAVAVLFSRVLNVPLP